MDHLCPEHVTLLTELARFQIAAHGALRAAAEPRSEAAANFAAQSERTTQEMLRRALALGDRTPVEAPLREMARRLGVSLDESTADWRALAFEGLRVMLDGARGRERREIGTYEEPTQIFRSVMASRAASSATVLPAVAAQATVPALAIPAANDTTAVSPACPTMPVAAAPTETEMAAPRQSHGEMAEAPPATAAPVVQEASSTPRRSEEWTCHGIVPLL